ncbi:PLP-dependent aminotransferase family protein [Burkholderia humptydooensis]|uniref:PLP-dependent aminotransferase family protein n=2 Tax=Burkholderia humptydooensis TaxID=430531 RepID=A0A7U4SQU3_9BURK|nr:MULTISPECIES: PLP-dependent aminotransferase family protein [Burkholderia]AJY43074.1 beta-eliminating lyase family protein [Burkholderia sp. 2002721687]ALX41086.1 GntR family transcriptional regulator [Burkholderia humptydooensis]EIP89297.1 transcriptional regulator, GntR family with aminotransferase domain protein [Burkholderia humptydooensis MSMB43]QPS43759.1 PLP-dependent aminotransferase family protein [Burkholderia humptydooensis]
MAESRYQTIVDDFAARIRAGTLAPGAQLPTVRALTKQHGIALATASRVYAELAEAGLVVGETGRGTFVRDTSLPRGLGLEQQPAKAGAIDLTFNYPSLPGQVELLRGGLRNLAASGDLDALLHSAPQGGRRHERQTVARHLRNRGIRVPAEQVLIVNGAQQGLAVTLMATMKPGELLAIDALTYPGMKALAHAHRIALAPLPLSAAQDLDLDRLDALCRKRPVRAVYTMPTLHNPLGSVMSAANRARLAGLAERHDLLVIEDGAYAFLAEPAPKPVFTHAPERTVYVSGLSKSVASGLRLGFVAAPERLVPALERAIRVSTWNTPSLTVALACQWIDGGIVDTLEDRKRKDARRRQTLARRILRDGDVVSHPCAYYLWLTMPEELRADRVAGQLERDGVLVTTAEPFSTAASAPHALRIALGSIALESLEDALRKVRRAVLG